MDPVSRLVYFGTSAAGIVDNDTYYFATIGTSGSDSPYQIAIGSNDDMYVATKVNGAAGILKLDVDAAVQWTRRFDDSGGESRNPFGLDLDSSDNVYLAHGYFKFDGTFVFGARLAKFNSSGTVQFRKEYGSAYPRDALVLASGNILTGYNSNVFFSTVNSSGTVQTQKQIGSSISINNEGRRFRQDSSNNVYVLANSSASGDARPVVIKMNSSFVIQWQKDYTPGSGEGAFGASFDIDSSGNVYFCGDLNSTTPEQGYIVKLNSSGALQWQKNIGITSNDIPLALTIDSNDNVYVALKVDSSHRPTGASGNAFGIIKFNSSGTAVWQRVLGGNGNFEVKDIAINSLGSVIVLVSNLTNTEGSNDVGILKVPADGRKTGSYSFGSDTLYYESMSMNVSDLSETIGTPTFSISSTSESFSSSSESEASASMTSTTVSF